MTLDKIEKRIETLLASDKRWPVIVDFSNKKDMEAFLYHFDVGNNQIVSAGSFCGKDGTLKLDEVTNRIENNIGDLFFVRLSAYMKLYGEVVLKNVLKTIISKSIEGHVVIVTYQCRHYLKFKDERFSERGQIMIAEDEFDTAPKLYFISPELSVAYKNSYAGFEKLGDAFETGKQSEVYISTDVDKSNFNMSLIHISQLTNAYDILCSKDARIKNIPEGFGDSWRWNELLQTMGSNDFASVVEDQLGTLELDGCVRRYPIYSDQQRWLYYIAFIVFGSKKDSYLNHVMTASTDHKDIPHAFYRTILTIDRNDEDFAKMYSERKEILKYFSSYLNEVVDYCKVVSTKQEDAVYYLTDLSMPEKEKVIDWLSVYGSRYTTAELTNIFKVVYPDLAGYLSAYRFKNALLDDYFEKYKYQKVTNKILPGFEILVEEQATELGFVSALQPRTQLFDKIDLKHAYTYFFDALGVEYLGFIQTKCDDYGLSINISCGRCELPSLTCFNRDFVETCKEKGCPISDIKTLDEIKHHGEDSFDYEKKKEPVYLIKELEIVDGLLKKIQSAILNNQYDKAVIVSDHGASRLAVLHETENIWEMETKGVHSGRCCPKNEINTKPDFAVEDAGYWVLTNYDRFKGGRKANVEVHGGATLEEVTIPIIEITRKMEVFEAFILEGYRKVSLSAKEIPVLKIYVGIISNNLSMKVNDKYYDAVATEEKYIYEVQLPDCAKKGTYNAEIVNGSSVLSIDNIFEVTKKGMIEVSLFD